VRVLNGEWHAYGNWKLLVAPIHKQYEIAMELYTLGSTWMASGCENKVPRVLRRCSMYYGLHRLVDPISNCTVSNSIIHYSLPSKYTKIQKQMRT
jgi:hypothetical protein